MYEATYFRRAKGLVKNGRARFVDDFTICLACPPNIYLEDTNTMTDIQGDFYRENNMVEQEVAPSMEYIMATIDKIVNHTDYIHQTIGALSAIDTNGSVDGSAGEKCKAYQSLILSRETTNQKLISLLEKMYNDLNPTVHQKSDDIIKLEQLASIISQYAPNEAADILRKSAQQMFVKAGCPTVK